MKDSETEESVMQWSTIIWLSDHPQSMAGPIEDFTGRNKSPV